jgi:ATP-dependent protease ClpP protease subunit
MSKDNQYKNENEFSPENNDSPQQQIVDMGSSVVTNRHGTIHCLTIIGQVEGHMLLPGTSKTTKYEHVLPLLAAIEESDEVDGLLVLLNTVGGDIEAGLAIAELIAGMQKPTVTLVLGGGHSIGIPLAVSGKVTMIAPSASMTIHPVRMSGTVIAVPATYQYFDRIQERIIAFVAKNSHISADRFRALMLATGDMANDVGSIVYGEEAVELGLMDQIGTLSDALNCLYEMIDHKNDDSDDEDNHKGNKKD